MISSAAGMAATLSQSVFSLVQTATVKSATPQAKPLANSNWFDSGRRFAATPRATRKTLCSAKAARKAIQAARSSLFFRKAVPENSRITETA